MDIKQQLKSIVVNYNTIDKERLLRAIEFIDSITELKERYKQLEFSTKSCSESTTYKQIYTDLELILNNLKE